MTKIELPDFDEFYELADKIKNTSLEVENLKLDIQKLEKVVITTMVGDETFYVGGKAPSMDFIKSTFKITGINGEILPLREKEIKLSADLDYFKRRYDILKTVVDIWRTQSSNERNALNM